ncbi:MAG: DUF58 domain-containing protein [Euryarchaeota archaeon]|nr:DUF58 domain-containing protein [Euryarchaeota archaeon]
MWTKKSVLVLGLGVSLAFLGLVFRSLPLMMTSVMLLSYLLVSMFLVRVSRVVPARKISSEKLFEDGDVSVQLMLHNKRLTRTGFLEVRDKLPKQLDVREGSNYLILDMRGGEKATINYRFVAPLRGIYNIGPVSMRSQDVYALFYEEANVEDLQSVTVFPRVEDVKDITIKARSLKLYPGATPVKRPGPGSEFFLVRDYLPGDPFKNINWKQYASKGKLLVNEHEVEAVSDVVIILDAREYSRYGTEAQNPIMFGARAAATMTNFFLKRRDSVGLIVYGDKLLTIKQGSGQKQLFEVLTALAGARSEGNLPFKGVVDYTAPFLPKRSPIMLISSLDGDDTIAEGVSTLRVLEYPVIIICPSSIEFELQARAKTRQGIGDPLPYEILKLERDILLSDLRGYGANVIDWDPKTPLLAVLRETKRI